MLRPWRAILVVSLGLAWCALASEGLRLPDLPILTPSDFQPEVRDQVQHAYDAARKQPRDAQTVGALGMLLDLYNRPDQALACYQRASRLDAHSFQWAYYLGSLLAKQGKHGEAAEALRGALRLNPNYLPAQLKLAESLFNAGDIDASKGVYAEILKRSPEVAEADFGLGRIAVARGDTTAARELFRKACELFPTYGSAHYALAQVDRKLGNSEEAKQELALYAPNKSVVPPIDDPLRDQLRQLDRNAAVHLERGVQLEQVGRVNDAIAETEEALRLDPGLVKAHINLLILYGRLGDIAKAEEHYQAAVKLNPDHFPDAYYNHGVLLLTEGRLQDAEWAFRKALDITPTYEAAHTHLGDLLERQGKLAEAAAEYRKALETNPSSRRTHFRLGRILVNQQKYQEAIEQFLQTTTPVDEETPTYLYALGATYGRAGDRANALRYLRQAKEEAAAHGQTTLVTQIEKDLAALQTRQPQGVPAAP